MSEIRVKEGESLESALRRFKRSTARSGVLAEVRKREAYEKPSVKRKKKSEAARKRKFKKLTAWNRIVALDFKRVANADVGEPETQALLFSFARLRGFLSC